MSLAILALPLSGCATVPSDQIVITRCPPLQKYAGSFQKQASEELNQLPPGSAVGKMVEDYSRIRDACRRINRMK
jgi:hypothetical protein